MATIEPAKGRYWEALAAVITAFTGVSDLYDRPTRDLEVHTDRETVDASVEHVGVLRRESTTFDNRTWEA